MFNSIYITKRKAQFENEFEEKNEDKQERFIQILNFCASISQCCARKKLRNTDTYKASRELESSVPIVSKTKRSEKNGPSKRQGVK